MGRPRGKMRLTRTPKRRTPLRSSVDLLCSAGRRDGPHGRATGSYRCDRPEPLLDSEACRFRLPRCVASSDESQAGRPPVDGAKGRVWLTSSTRACATSRRDHGSCARDRERTRTEASSAGRASIQERHITPQDPRSEPGRCTPNGRRSPESWGNSRATARGIGRRRFSRYGATRPGAPVPLPIDPTNAPYFHRSGGSRNPGLCFPRRS